MPGFGEHRHVSIVSRIVLSSEPVVPILPKLIYMAVEQGCTILTAEVERRAAKYFAANLAD